MRYPGRRAKIVCTIGPAVHSQEGILQLVQAGMDVARLNFSHGTHEFHKKTIGWLREASRQTQIPVAILGDLQGPKIRTGKLADKDNAVISTLTLTKGLKLFFKGVEATEGQAPGAGAEKSPIVISYPRLGLDLKAGDPMLFDDGLVRMTVLSTQPEKNLVEASVDFGTTLGTNKGVNMPGARLSTLGITEKDWDDVLFALKEDVDILALSFVRTGREVRQLKSFLEQKGQSIHVIAKIERGEAIQAIDEILAASDGLMVARGDLGVEVGNENVPVLQKRIIQKARMAGKPVITATQMLMSMVESPSPSRAEASDVANAVLDGSDALMLSNETASGKYPFAAVEAMASIILGAETFGSREFGAKTVLELAASTGAKPLPVSEGIEAAATALAASLHAKGLACLTRSGQAARLLAKYRPAASIFAFAENEKVRRQLSLTWGVSVIPWHEMKLQDYTAFDDMALALGKLGLLKNGDLVVMTAGIPTSREVGTTNTVVVRQYPPPPREGPTEDAR